jgi:hypothetical protein
MGKKLANKEKYRTYKLNSKNIYSVWTEMQRGVRLFYQ